MWRVEVTGGPRALRPAARRAAAAAVRAGVPGARWRDLELAVHEALTNALEHGHLGEPALPIRVEVARVGQATVAVRVVDAAVGGRWDPARGAPPAAGSPVGTAGPQPAERGRGRALIRVLVDTVVERSGPGGTVVELLVVAAGSGGPRRSSRALVPTLRA